MGARIGERGLVTSGVLMGLPAVIRLLCSPTSPATVIERIVTGPLAVFDASAGILMRGVADDLVLVGSYGYAPGDLAGFETMPVGADLPICQAYRDGEYVVTSTVAATSDFADLASEPDRWDEFYARTPHGSIVSVPLISQGVAVGCLGFSCSEERSWGTDAVGLLDCLSSAVAMWMAHPISGFSSSQEWVPSGPVVLTPRQQRVLLLCSEGASTAVVARDLRYSESTVKQEMQRIMRLLETSDRAVAVQRAASLGLIAGGTS